MLYVRSSELIWQDVSKLDSDSIKTYRAKAIESVGARPEYGAPVLMPPSDRLSGALSIASSMISIASGLGVGNASGILWN